MANFNVTLPKARFTPLTVPERTNGYTHKYTILYSDVASATGAVGITDTVTVILGNTPARYLVPAALAIITTPFAGTGGLAASVGTVALPTVYLPSVSVLAGTMIQAATGPNTVNTPGSAFGNVSVTPAVIFTNSGSGSPSGVVAGQLDVYLTILEQTQLG